MASTPKSPFETLRNAWHSTAAVGAAFLLAGIFLGFVTLMQRQRNLLVELMNLAASVMLVGPGIWYIMTAVYLRKRQLWPIVISFRVAAAQSVIVVLSLLIQAIRFTPYIMVPAIMAVMFLPALFALVFELRRARRAIQMIEPDGHAFEIVNVQGHEREADG